MRIRYDRCQGYHEEDVGIDVDVDIEIRDRVGM